MDTQTILISNLFEFSRCAFRERHIGRLMTLQFGNCDLQISGTWSCHLILKQVLSLLIGSLLKSSFDGNTLY